MSKSDWQKGYDIGKKRGYNYGRNDWKTAIVTALVNGVVNIAAEIIQNKVRLYHDTHPKKNTQSQNQEERS